jgi:hypothetical protein
MRPPYARPLSLSITTAREWLHESAGSDATVVCSADGAALHLRQRPLKACFDDLSTLLPVALCKIRVCGQLSLCVSEFEQSFCFFDGLLVSLYLKKQTEGKLIQDDFRTWHAPRRATLLINERWLVSKLREDSFHRIGVFHDSLLFEMLLDGRRGIESTFVSEDGSITDAPQTQCLCPPIQTASRVQRILFKLFALGRGLHFLQATQHSPPLLTSQAILFFALNAHW